MTDKELLAQAARGVHLVLWKAQDDGSALLVHGGDRPIKWDPLQDDGDALRLAVGLRKFMPGRYFAITIGSAASVTNADKKSQAYHNDDPVAATRRAIVCAAAELGLAAAKLDAPYPTSEPKNQSSD